MNLVYFIVIGKFKEYMCALPRNRTYEILPIWVLQIFSYKLQSPIDLK